MQFKQFLLFLLTLIPCFSFSPELLSIQHRINYLESLSTLASRNLTALAEPSLSSPPSHPLPIYSSPMLKFTSKCNHTGPGYLAFLFQTISNVYFAINSPSLNSISFFNHRCQPLSSLPGVQIKEILCDRGICQAGTLHFLTKDGQLFSASEDKNFSLPTNLASLDGQMVGGVIRNRGKDKIQIYIGSEDGVIRVIDESGVGKLRIELQGFNTRMGGLRDHHPYPIVTMQESWISMLDTSKYTEISPNCPHIPNIRYILSENYYGEAVYVVTKDSILMVDFELSKKSCTVKRQYDLGVELGAVRWVSYFSNTIFIDGYAYNLTEKKLYGLGLGEEASMSFIYKKSQSQEIYSLRQWCERGECNIQFLEIKKLNEDRSVLFWITIAFIAVLFLSISFMKKSSINNLDLDDPTRLKERQIQQQIMALTKHAKQLQSSASPAPAPSPTSKKPIPKKKLS